MSKFTSWFRANLSGVKTVLNGLFNTQKPKMKAFVHDKADDFYNGIDHVTEATTARAFEDYLVRQAGGSRIGGVVAGQIVPLIEIGIATGLVDMGLEATDALTRQELDKIVSCIDARIDGARF